MKTILASKMAVILFIFIARAFALGADVPKDEINWEELNKMAFQCVTTIRQQLAMFSNQHKTFKGIDKAPIHADSAKWKTAMNCEFGFKYRLKYVRYEMPNGIVAPQDGYWTPEDDGVNLEIGFRKLVRHQPATKRFVAKTSKTEITAFYFLELGKDVKQFEIPIKVMVEKQLQEFWERASTMK